MQESGAQLKKRMADVREKVQRVGLTTAIGYLLRRQREQLPISTRPCRTSCFEAIRP